MAHDRKREHGAGFVTHKPRGRFTLVSPQNADVRNPTERPAALPRCSVCGVSRTSKARAKLCCAARKR